MKKKFCKNFLLTTVAHGFFLKQSVIFNLISATFHLNIVFLWSWRKISTRIEIECFRFEYWDYVHRRSTAAESGRGRIRLAARPRRLRSPPRELSPWVATLLTHTALGFASRAARKPVCRVQYVLLQWIKFITTMSSHLQRFYDANRAIYI